jgi:NAD(P)H-dependent FMN reductase
MKITLINGSPKPKDSVSGLIAEALRKRIGAEALRERTSAAADCACALCNVVKQERGEIIEAMRGSDALVFIFPLYVDGLPSHLLRLLDEERDRIAEAAPGATVYAVLNNGFYEGRQNALALEMMRSFTVRAGLTWGRGVGVGAGPMTFFAPIGRGPMKRLGAALDALAKDIPERAAADDYSFEPNFPKFLYEAAAHHTWRRAARKRGLTIKRLYKK